MKNTKISILSHASPAIWVTRVAGQCLLALAVTVLALPAVQAQETVCASVKIRIKQELTLERQAFDAEMKINNTTDSSVIENVSVVVKVTEENGTPVAVSEDPNNVGAKFFLRVASKQAISDITGAGTVAAQTTAIIDWLLIPAPGSAGANPLGKKYLVGATLKYRFGGEEQTLDVSPAVITVKPLPLLTLDYFLTQDVFGDDPLTPEIEAVEPYTLGVRVKNAGFAAAKNLKIDSAQPTIVENNQGLLINFKLTGSYVNDAPVQNSLLINFGDIAAATSKTGRKLILGGVEIPFHLGLLGHSDADVLLHAITDALLGAAALGDIGTHFPDTDARFKGADSAVLLTEAARRVRDKGFEIGNVDSTVIAQAPKLMPHMAAIRAQIALALGVNEDQVNVKAKTAEKMGPVGQGQAMEARAIVLLTKLK